MRTSVWHALSLRTKLTIWYVSLMAAVLMASTLIAHWYLSRSLRHAVDASLSEQVQLIEARLRAIEGGQEFPEPRTERFTIAPAFVELITPEGEIADVAAASENERVPIRPETLERVRTSRDPVAEEAHTRDGRAMRVVTWRALDARGELEYFIRAGYVIEDIHRAEQKLLGTLLVTTALALIVASLGGMLLATRALRPVDRLIRAARTITAHKLKERVEVPPSRDELARLAETFNQMISRLDEAFERERRFTEDASHELRTPLAILRSELEIALRRERPAEEYRQTLQRCLDEVLRLSRLTDDLLWLSRSESGHLALNFTSLRLDGLCRDVVAQMRPIAEARHLNLTLQESEEPLPVRGDPHCLRRLLLNLLDNALKFTPSDGRVTLRMNRIETHARVEVEDTGCGIPAEDLPHIFERFYRRPFGERAGAGLGLAISRWIVEAHGGRIWAESELGRGSRFIVELPLAGAMSEEG
ncbi:MAG: heavy metal sensor histidine kinase [Blastocatellia bacterium]|nr:heavy metal sensor histidine kinase [Blastocatellia bacterium]MCS7157024.1 heavy metal sensor histidine kinase [Blastocatellia bacterium]MCX7752225.1 heavy metal sensor histidine kinase [Blastocatellia bacterium]MDW8167717.1 heavy metal sensor histidine kinase [Acidobacteriota bacterium]MDW8256316.1 heavy metal sensor histidine kinase [Acidobacteriota bacterium]